jgi:AmiR/NasT family two-component response regulator
VSADEGKPGLWASLVDGLMKALQGAFIAIASVLAVKNEELSAKLKEAQDELQKQREVARARGDQSERERVRSTWSGDKDPGP